MTARLRGVSRFDKFTVHILPVLQNNFCYIVQCEKTRHAAVVDCSEVEPVVSFLSHNRITDFSILTTHKHWDHSGGNVKMAERFKGLQIFGSAKDNVPGCTRALHHGDHFSLGELVVTVYHTPCHTSGHVLYHVVHPSGPEEGALFTGDTFFVGGIGAFFEGNAAQMCDAVQIVAKLPPPTRIFPGHEYTLNFMKFSHHVLPQDAFVLRQLEEVTKLVSTGQPTVPSTIEAELRHNMFMRVFDPVLQAHKKTLDPIQLMQLLYDECP